MGMVRFKKNIYCNKSEHMLNKLSNKNNKFSKYRMQTVLFYNHGEVNLAHTVLDLL